MDWKRFKEGIRVFYVGNNTTRLIGTSGTVIKRKPDEPSQGNNDQNINVAWDSGEFMGVFPKNLMVLHATNPAWEV